MSHMMPPRQHKNLIGPSMLIRGRIILKKGQRKKVKHDFILQDKCSRKYVLRRIIV